MTKDKALKLALEALEDAGKDDFWRYQDKAITAIKEALAQQNQFNPDWDVMAVMVEEQQRMAKRIAELEAQPEQPKYRRGNRLVCLETDEYCVIHISGTDRQWVKFPDSHIGVYTNEQVAELFELLPKQPEPWEKFCDSNCVWTDHHPDCKLAEQSTECGEPVATDWERIARVQDAKLRAMCNEAGGFEKLCEVMDKYERTTPPQRKPLTAMEVYDVVHDADLDWHTGFALGEDENRFVVFARAIEAAHGIIAPTELKEKV